MTALGLVLVSPAVLASLLLIALCAWYWLTDID